MQKIIKILVAIIILIGLLYMYPKVKKRLNGYYEDRISCTFYGVGEPFKEALNGGKFLNIGLPALSLDAAHSGSVSLDDAVVTVNGKDVLDFSALC